MVSFNGHITKRLASDEILAVGDKNSKVARAEYFDVATKTWTNVTDYPSEITESNSNQQ